MRVIVDDITRSGTTAARDIAYPTPTGNETWDNTTLGYRQWYNAASAQWEKDLTPVNGAMPVADGQVAVEVQIAGGYTYIAIAAPNYGRFASRALHLAAAEWAASRVDSNGTTLHAGTGANSVATNLTALTYV